MEILGIDIGGTGIKGAIVNTQKGTLITERYRVLTPNPATPEAVSKIIYNFTKHFQWNGPIGCGFPSVVQKDIVKTASNIDKSWVNINLAELISRVTSCKTKVINDADAAGIAEMKFGSGKGNKDVVIMITVGTGIGSAIFTNGKLFPNTEFGQIIFRGDIAEKYISGKIKKDQNLSWKKWSFRFNEYIEYIEKLIYPDMIIIGGGLCKKSEKFIEYISANSKIEIAQLRNNAGIIGAAMYAETK